MAPKLYKMDLSPGVRAVYLTAEALKVNLQLIETNFVKNETLQPEFMKLNPQHTVPTLEDNGKVIWDSHAINAYLVTKYGKDDSLYPKNPYKRAVIDQRLHFDSGIAYSLFRTSLKLIWTRGVKTVPQHLVDEIIQAYEFLEKFLGGHQWVAGDQLTIADFSLLASTTSLDTMVPIDSKKYPNVTAWIKRAEQLPYYRVNQNGLTDLKNLVQKLREYSI